MKRFFVRVSIGFSICLLQNLPLQTSKIQRGFTPSDHKYKTFNDWFRPREKRRKTTLPFTDFESVRRDLELLPVVNRPPPHPRQ
jgi:hypothetical protein